MSDAIILMAAGAAVIMLLAFVEILTGLPPRVAYALLALTLAVLAIYLWVRSTV